MKQKFGMVLSFHRAFYLKELVNGTGLFHQETIMLGKTEAAGKEEDHVSDGLTPYKQP